MKKIIAITILSSLILLLTACNSATQTVSTEKSTLGTEKQTEVTDDTTSHTVKETSNTENLAKTTEKQISVYESTEASTPETVYVNTKSKSYYMETKNDTDAFTPCLSVFDDGTFGFTYDILSSYLAQGTYTIEDQELILKTNDGNHQYIFHIDDDDTLLFVKDKSSDVSLFQKDFGDEITDGARFILSK